MTLRSEQTREKMIKRIEDHFEPVHLEIIDETWRHVGHAGAQAGGGHFIVWLVSKRFEGTPLLERNRMVFDLFRSQIGVEIHALGVKAFTPEEWNQREDEASRR